MLLGMVLSNVVSNGVLFSRKPSNARVLVVVEPREAKSASHLELYGFSTWHGLLGHAWHDDMLTGAPVSKNKSLNDISMPNGRELNVEVA